MVNDIMRERLQSAKQVSLIGLIHELGYDLSSDGSYYSMISPFRGEKKGSFMIDKRKITKWRDFGNGKSGDVIDFVMELYPYNLKEAVDYLLSKRNIPTPVYETVKADTNAIEIISIEDLTNPSLIEYLEGRKISIHVAKKYLKQALISFPNGKHPYRKYSVIAWKNNSGGYEFRNGFFKLGNTPKDVTNINEYWGADKGIFLFEGFSDYLSYLTKNNLMKPFCKSIVLNSASFAPIIAPILRNTTIWYLGHNDKAGDKAYNDLIEAGCKVLDKRSDYADYNDINDFLCGKKKIKTIKQILNLQ